MIIFFDLLESCIEVFMDDFTMVPPLMHVWIASIEFLTDALRLTLFLTLKNAILWSMKV